MPLLDRLRPFVFRGIIHGGSFLLTHGACDRMLRDPRSGQILMHGNAAVQAVGAWVAGLPFQLALKTEDGYGRKNFSHFRYHIILPEMGAGLE